MRIHPIVTVDALFCLRLIPLSHRNLCMLLLLGNKRDRLDTLIKCAEWSQFAFQRF